MNRVMEGNVTDNMKCTWEDLTERIIKLAVSETDNHNVQSMISAASKELSEGMSSNTTLCLICHSNVSSYISDALSLHALILLYYMLPDTRFRADHSRLMMFFSVRVHA